jgi:hypothetical protein
MLAGADRWRRPVVYRRRDEGTRIVFATKEHADKAVAYPLPPLPGVTPLKVEIREVYASA